MAKHTLLSLIFVFLAASLAVVIPFEQGLVFADTTAPAATPVVGASVDPTVSTAGGIKNSCSPPLNFRDSIILSVLTMCIPGILEGIQKWREVECKYIVCVYNSATAGIGTDGCEKERSFSICKNVVGELFAVPPMSFVEYVRKAVAQFLMNPIGVAFAIATTIARHGVTAGCETGCFPQYASIIIWPLFIIDTAALVQMFMDISKQKFDYFWKKRAESACEQVPEIVKEVQDTQNKLKLAYTSP